MNWDGPGHEKKSYGIDLNIRVSSVVDESTDREKVFAFHGKLKSGNQANTNGGGGDQRNEWIESRKNLSSFEDFAERKSLLREF